MTMAGWQMACNRVEHRCGCVSWLEVEPGGWVRKVAPCQRHRKA